VLRSVTLLGIVAIGVAFTAYGKHYVDLSIPAVMTCAGMAAVSALPWGIGAGLACGLLAGLAIGFVNGWVVGYLRVNPIIWTLAMVFLLDGLLRMVYSGHQIYPDAATPGGSAFLGLSQLNVLGVFPGTTLFMLGLAAVGQWLMKRTRFGAQTQLTGAAYDVARLSGVPVERIVMLTFLASAFTGTAAGLLLTSLNRQGTFDTGVGYDFDAVTAVVLGGVALTGGRGSVFGVLGGLLVIGVLVNLMTLLGLNSFAQMVVKGAVFVVVVGLTSWLSRRTGHADV
jgi:ribose/xylose/arabinose/galactoside ABC-type transport system permease subunit